MRAHSVDTCHVVGALPLPQLGDAEHAQGYVRRLNTLAAGLPPSIFVCNGQDIPFISTCI